MADAPQTAASRRRAVYIAMVAARCARLSRLAVCLHKIDAITEQASELYTNKAKLS